MGQAATDNIIKTWYFKGKLYTVDKKNFNAKA